jgi:hypothetical protein
MCPSDEGLGPKLKDPSPKPEDFILARPNSFA